MVGIMAGNAQYQWLLEGLVVPCSNGGRMAGGAQYQWLLEGLVVPSFNVW
jgi:hypothetical protein